MSKLIILIITLCISFVLISGCTSSGEQKIPSTTTSSPRTISTMIPSTVTSSLQTQKIPEETHNGVQQSTTNILIKGTVYGFADGNNLPIKTVNLTLGVAPGAPSVDLTKMKIVYSNATIQPQILTYVAGTVIPTANSTFSASQISVAGDDQVTISIPISAAGAPPNTEMNFELRPGNGGAAIPFSKTVPPTVNKVNVLR